jgi:hypothetical protein
MEPRPLRIAYAIEFLLALIACFECWSQIGGQAPLDLMPWWLKLLLAAGFAAAFVRLTAVAVRNHPFPAVPVIRWGVAFVLVLAVIALITYYFFLHVPPEQDNSDEPIPTSYVLR